jgi:hypothetical protein
MKKASKISILPRPSVISQITNRDPQAHTFAKNRDLVEEFVLVSALTGEEVARYVLDGRVLPKPGDWVRLYQSFAEQFASDPENPVESRALWLVVARAGFGNLARINVTDVAAEWGVSREAISRALSSLVRRRVIERAKGGSYRLNPNFCWKGSAATRPQMCAKWNAKSEPTIIDDSKPATA